MLVYICVLKKNILHYVMYFLCNVVARFFLNLNCLSLTPTTVQLLEYGTSVTETYPQSITAWNLDAHYILILANYMTFDDHTEGINLAIISDKCYLVWPLGIHFM